MKKEPLISVIIPVYNPGKYFIDCIESILNQTYDNLEVILVDDGSSDGSGKICDGYAAADSRVIVIHQSNLGVSKARNKGLENATGDFYHFPDSDDYLEKNTYEECLKMIHDHDCNAVVFEHYITYSNREVRHEMSQKYYGLYEGKDEIVKINFRTAFTFNKFFSKEIISGSDTLSGVRFREDIFRGEDTLFSRDALERANKVWFTNEPLYHYVQSEESACRGAFRLSQLSLLAMIEDNKKYYDSKFPKYMPSIITNELEAIIMLYGDMYLDSKDYSYEQEKLHEKFVSVFNDECNYKDLRLKQIIKFLLFKNSPRLFMTIHKCKISHTS